MVVIFILGIVFYIVRVYICWVLKILVFDYFIKIWILSCFFNVVDRLY